MEHPDIAFLLDTTAYILITLSVRRLAYGSSSQQLGQALLTVR
jgi:hypothetical protein